MCACHVGDIAGGSRGATWVRSEHTTSPPPNKTTPTPIGAFARDRMGEGGCCRGPAFLETDMRSATTATIGVCFCLCTPHSRHLDLVGFRAEVTDWLDCAFVWAIPPPSNPTVRGIFSTVGCASHMCMYARFLREPNTQIRHNNGVPRSPWDTGCPTQHSTAAEQEGEGARKCSLQTNLRLGVTRNSQSITTHSIPNNTLYYYFREKRNSGGVTDHLTRCAPTISRRCFPSDHSHIRRDAGDLGSPVNVGRDGSFQFHISLK